MNYKAVLGVVLVLMLIAVPVAGAGNTVFEEAMSAVGGGSAPAEETPIEENPVTPDEGDMAVTENPLPPGANNYGYLKISSISYDLKNMDADITINYTMEPWLSFLVTFLGKQDQKDRIINVLQYPEKGYNQEVTFKYVGNDKAIVHVTNVAVDNMDSSYWLKPHSFGCTIPELTFIISENNVKTFYNVKDMAKGLGYFKT